jgi:putative protease
MDAGVSSFKIEGRLKDESYVKNVVSHYRRIIDNVIDSHPDLYRRASSGRSEVSFVPQPDKSFNRGFTGYFVDQRRPKLSIASIHTPKSLGEELTDTSMINNGDGISFFNEQGEYTGFRVNRVERGRIIPAQPVRIPRGATLYRTSDTQWDRQMSRPTAVRKIDIDIRIDETGVSATDEMGNHVRLPLNVTKEVAQKPLNVRNAFEKLGNTIYRLRNFESALDPKTFIPMSQLTDVRRELIEALTATAKTRYRHNLRRPEDRQAIFPADRLDYRDNVANSLSRQFYKEHGVKQIETAMEASDRPQPSTVVMTCRHCILRELKMCKRDNPQAIKRYREPLTITSGDIRLQLRFNCADCEMQVLTT